MVHTWREAPMPPLEGEVVERQRNRRGLFVNRAVQETPQSAYGCQLPFQGRPWQNQNPPPFNAQLNFPTLRAAISRPYRACAKRFLSSNEPGGSGNRRIGTSPVRHCPAALPPRADSIRPYSLGGEAAAIQRTALFRSLRADIIRPYNGKAPVFHKTGAFSQSITVL